MFSSFAVWSESVVPGSLCILPLCPIRNRVTCFFPWGFSFLLTLSVCVHFPPSNFMERVFSCYPLGRSVWTLSFLINKWICCWIYWWLMLFALDSGFSKLGRKGLNIVSRKNWGPLDNRESSTKAVCLFPDGQIMWFVWHWLVCMQRSH